MAGLFGEHTKKVLTVMTALFACVSFACLCIAIGTDYWLYAIEVVADSNQTTSRMRTHSGLWKACTLDVRVSLETICSYIKYLEDMDLEDLGPTDSIKYSMRKVIGFPLSSLAILISAEIVCFVGYCHQRNVLTFVSGILFVIGGLFTLIGIILYISAVSEEVDSSPESSMDEPKFEYRYGPSFAMTISSFFSCELTGVLSVYLYIVQCKHAYHKQCERLNTEQISTTRPSQSPASSAGSRYQIARENSVGSAGKLLDSATMERRMSTHEVSMGRGGVESMYAGHSGSGRGGNRGSIGRLISAYSYSGLTADLNLDGYSYKPVMTDLVERKSCDNHGTVKSRALSSSYSSLIPSRDSANRPNHVRHTLSNQKPAPAASKQYDSKSVGRTQQHPLLQDCAGYSSLESYDTSTASTGHPSRGPSYKHQQQTRQNRLQQRHHQALIEGALSTNQSHYTESQRRTPDITRYMIPSPESIAAFESAPSYTSVVRQKQSENYARDTAACRAGVDRLYDEAPVIHERYQVSPTIHHAARSRDDLQIPHHLYYRDVEATRGQIILGANQSRDLRQNHPADDHPVSSSQMSRDRSVHSLGDSTDSAVTGAHKRTTLV